METNDRKFVKNPRQRGEFPLYAWGYGPVQLRMTLSIRRHVSGRFVINTSGTTRIVPEEEARRVAEVALREVNLRPPDLETQKILYEWGLLAKLPASPEERNRKKPTVPDRSMRVGFSEIPILMGLSPYSTPLDLWRMKKGLDTKKEETFPMRWGKEAEEAALRIAKEQLGMLSWRTWRQYPAVDGPLAGHLDAVVAHKGAKVILEIKILSSLGAMDAYRAQVNAQMGASGIYNAHLCVVYMNRELIIEKLEFSPELYQQQKALAEEFMRRVREDDPPLPGGMAHNPDSEVLTVSEGEIVELLNEYKKISEEISPLKEKLDAIKEKIKKSMDTAGIKKIIAPAGTAILRTDVRESLDTRALKEAHPELVSAFLKRTSVKVLTIN